jgi:hypothetical protein
MMTSIEPPAPSRETIEPPRRQDTKKQTIRLFFVIPAKAGIYSTLWMPAYAGMTE